MLQICHTLYVTYKMPKKGFGGTVSPVSTLGGSLPFYQSAIRSP